MKFIKIDTFKPPRRKIRYLICSFSGGYYVQDVFAKGDKIYLQHDGILGDSYDVVTTKKALFKTKEEAIKLLTIMKVEYE